MRIWQLTIVLGLFHLGKASTKLDCSRRKLDLVFLLDSSGSVRLHNFKSMLSFVKSFLSTTSIDDGNVRVGVVTFNSRAHIQFHLNQYKTKKELFRAIDKIKYKKGGTNTYAGLRTLRTKMFSKRRGDRRAAKNVALVITDGLSNRNAKKTIPEAKAVRKANIHIYAIGIGLKKRTAELEGIASRPIEENRFTVKDFKGLGGLKEKVFASVCQFATTPLPPKDCSRRKLDLVFLLDSSGSVRLHNFKSMLSFVKSFLSTTSIDDGNVRVGVVTFNSRAHIQFHLNQYKTKKELFRAIDKIKYKKGGTNTYAGLRTLRTKMFSKRRGDRRAAKNVALVITDGLSNRNAKKTIPEAKAVRKANIHIYAIGIGLKKRTAELEGIASRPIEENRFTVKDFKGLGGLKEKVFASVCQFATTPLPPKDCSRRKLDLVFLLDSSGSVRLHNFKSMLSFVKSFLSTTSIDDGNVRVGVVTFNSRAHIQFHLNQYKTKKELFRAIDKIKYKKGGTNTYAGLRTLRTKMFSKRRGDRRAAKNVALVITDGLSNRNAKKTIPEAKAVRKANIHIYAIGIGLKKRTAELEGIASRPIEENRFTVKDFKGLGGLKEKVFASVCQFATTPLPPKDCSRRKLDLVFLLDSSGSVRLHNFKSMLSFVKSFLSTTSIDDGNVRVGVVTFNSRAHIQFHLNQYKTKKELFRAIDKIKYKKGGTNTYAGLRTLRTKMFSKRRGDRRAAKNVALVITDGLSNRNAKKTIPEAKAVRKANIHIYAIGIGLKKRTAELEGIASRPIEENRFTVKDFKGLGGLKEKVFASVCQFATTPLPPKDCSRRKLDLVFLLDSSGSVRLHNFKSMLSFVKSFLSTTSIDDGNVRVGVVTFNSRAHIQFHLNQYKTKKELFRAIDKIKYKKGGTNTYAGLRTLRTKMFSKRRGDRRAAKNVALVITDGLSNRNAKKTIPEAKAVRKANIHIYAIGIGLKKRTAELEGIASRPIEENRFTVKDFKGLGGLKEKVFASVCQFATTPLPPKDCSRRKLDLVFLLDSSGSVRLHNFKSMLSFVKSFLSTTSIDDGNVRVGVVTFNSRAHIQFHLNQYKTKKELFRAIDKIKYKKGGTNTYAGLRTLRTKMFSKRRGDRRAAKNVALVITDGLSNRNAKKTIPEAKAVRKANIHIYAIGIGLKKRTAELEGIASRPIEENRFTVKDFKGLGGLKEKVFASVCQFATTPLPPKDCSRRKLDLVFLLDSSGSVRLHNFKSMLSFVKSFLSTTSIDDGNVRVGVVTFNSRAHIQFHLNQYKTKKELFRAIDKIKYKKGGTNTYAGLRTLRTKMFSKRRGDRRAAKNVALVITDGLSNRNAKKTIPEAKAVRKANIHIYAIGIGLKKRTAELEGIASRPIEENRFTVKDFKGLGGLKEKVFASVCQFATTPLPPKDCSRRKLDLVFLLDSSGSVRLHNFKSMLSFVKSFLSTTSIDDGNVRVGVVTFNSRAHIQFHLNQYKTKKELFRAIDKIKYKKGGTNTYAGLRTLRTKMFSKRRGDRRAAKNVALVITDGLSNRNAKKTIPEAKAVRKANIHIYAIGIGLKKRTAELEGIASRPIEENRFTVKDFKGLGGLKEKVFASVCQFATTPLPPKDCSRRKLDLVFLLDSSGSVRLHNFKSMLSFVKSFLSTTSIDDGNVRVGVVTFNSRAHIQFHLNQYKTKKELFRAIDKIKYKKGGTNTYAGLRTLRTKMFSKRRGDRRAAKNVALVITDGLSNRNAKKTIPEAKAVRKANIHIYAIGIGLKKRTAELEGIASRPIEENRFTVKDFKGLGGLKEKVFASVCQFATTPLPPKDCSRRKLDLVFLLDSSGSVRLHNFKSMLSFVKSFLSTTSIDDGNVRVGVVTFNSRAHIQFHLNQYKTKKELFRAIDKIKYKKGGTNTYAGLRTLRTKMFSKRRGDRRAAKNVALVITDGLSNRNAKKTIPEAKAVRKANIHIYAIGIGLKKRTAELEGIASRPIEENRFTVKDFKGLGGLKEKVFASVCQFATTPLPPKDCSRRKLDLVFLLDSSGSVRLHNFKSMLSFVKSFLSTTSIDDGNVRVGVVTFNSRAHIQFHLNQYKTKKELFRAIDKIKYKKGGTNTYAGLRTLRTKMFSKRRGDRRAAKNVALVITDGLSNRNAKKTIPEAKAVRKANIHIYAIGIGLKKRTAELEGIASRPIEENRFTVKDFKGLGGLKEKVFASVCQFATTPLPPKDCSRRKLDLVFLLDSSGSVRLHNFKSMLSFVKSFLSTTSIDDGNVRVGVVTFNSRAHIQFHLNQYKTKKELFRAIDKIKYKKGGTNTYAGLRTLRTKMFSKRRGDRRAAKNVALVITDGLSNRNAKKTIPEAKAVRKANIHIYAIGIGLKKRTAELEGIASRPIEENRFTVKDFKGLGGLKEKVFASVCQFATTPLPPKDCSRRKLDLVFLLDSSGSVRLHNFKSMLSFVKSFLSTTSIDDGNVRVGVVTFNSRAHIQFHLNQYKTKKELFRAIDKIKYKKGGTNTYAGLRTLRTKMFSKRRGDRRAAKNVALVITDGLSNRNAKKTIPEAKAVRKANIHIYAIGIGLKKRTAELEGIASRPIEENRFTVKDFKGLGGLKEKVFASVCQFATTPLPPKDCSRRKLDLVFLLDSSGSVRLHNFKSMLSFVKSFLSTTSIDDGNVRVGVVTFNSRAHIQFHLNQYKTKKELFRAIDKIKYKKGGTNTYAGLRTLRTKMFSKRRGDRRAAKNVALVITDGLSNRNAKKTIPEAKAVRKANIHIYAIGIGLKKRTAELEGIASRPIEENRFTVKDFKGLGGLKEKVFASVCQFATTPLPPKDCSRRKLDLVFLLDSSGSVRLHNFKSMLSFVKSFLSTTSIDDGNVRVGVVTFNSRAHIQFHLNQYKTKKELFRAIDKIKYKKGGTNTYAGLRTLRTKMFSKRRGDRRAAKNVALVITDGLSNRNAKKTIPEAKAVRKANIHIYAIGIGLKKRTAELEGIASRPIEENRFTVKDFKGLGGLKEKVFASVCQFATTPLPPKDCSRRKLDLVFLLDSSGSVRLHNFKSMLSFVKSFLSTTSIDDGNVRVGVVTFNSRAHIQFHLNQYKTKKELFRAIDKIKYKKGGTNTYAGLRTLRTKMFSKRRGDRRAAKNVALVITDGLSNRNAKKTIPEAKAVRKANIHIYAIGIGLKKRTAELEGIASRPIEENRFTVKDFKGLGGLKEKVFASVCQFATTPLPPKDCSRRKLDLVFLLDSSGSVRLHNFKSMLSFVKSFLSTTSIDDGNVRVGVVTFNSRAHIQFHLNQYKTKKELFRAIDKIKYKKGGTNTYAGLRTLRTKMFSKRRGDRRAAKNVALVITDGLSNRNAKKTIPEAKAVRKANIHIYAIGIGLKKRTAELEGIASRPIEENRFTVKDFKGLGGLKEKVFASVCQFATTPLPPKDCSRRKLDLVFLLDSSGSVRLHNFKSMLSFVKSFLSTTSIDDGNVRVGVVTFNSRAHIQFHLNQYKTKKELFRAIDKIKYKKGGTNTYAGLRTLRTKMFSKRRGDRRAAKNVALVITDGLSNRNAKKTIPEAKAVRKANIHIYAIGIGLKKRTAELEGIASRPIEENRFTVKDFKGLGGLKEKVFASVCQFATTPLPPKDCSRRKLDLVFLLDSSGSVRLHNFKSMLSFVKSFLSTTSIDDGNVRVGVVTFNSRAHIQFHLNQYKTKKELFRAIDKIKYKKGGTNTYAGLRTLRTKMFSKRRGDRRAAKNVALVITDGLSNRNAKKTIPEAKAVRKANIHIYAIGIGLKKRTAELEGIASRPIEENRFTVKDFKGLGGLKEKVFASVCQFATTPLPPKDCSRRKLDLVFLLDSSGSVRLHNFKSMLSFVKSFLSTTSIDDGNVRVGVVTFNSRAHIQFHLNQYKTKKELFRAIDKIKYKKGGTNTYAGLRTLRTKMFSKRRGDRRAAKNVALVITDGLSNRNAKKTIPEAKAVRKANIHIYAIGIGLKKRTAELEGIASRPIEENRFTVKDFKGLGGLKEKVFASVCQFATTPLPPKGGKDIETMPYRKRPTQCTNCMLYGHTKTSCNQPPKCRRKVGVGRCHERRCRNGGTCKQIGPLKWKCLCRRGFRGSRCKRKVGVGRCHERRCRNGGTCKQIGPLKWKCLCRRGFRGSRCKRKVGVGRCHERRCRNGGTCKQIGPLKWKCLCRRGFRGSRCKRKVGVGRCHERRCRNGGTCKQIGPLKWKCLCRRGFRGSRCKRKVGVGECRCHERRCRNGGTCKQIGPLKWKCLCRRGFRGSRCKRKVGVGRCHERRCRNGGTCKQIGPLKWKCLCRRGFRGSRCKRKVGVGECRCHERRCRNGGTCKQIGPLKWKCLCRRGFRGSRCKRKVGVGRCHERRCRNGGTCKQIGPLKWKCLCRRGFRGSRCKRKVGVGRCHERRCRNGGTCKQIGPLKWKCLCRRGFRGSRCKRKVGVGRCHERRCRNGGTCKQIGPLKWKCLCRRGFRGSRCKRKVGVGRCHERRCRNGGTCKQIGPLKWKCLCRRGFRGSRCKRKVGVGECRCHERRCRNGGTCKQIGPLKWKCLCRRGFRGSRCKRKVGVGRCHERRCRNGGTCKQIGPLKWKCLCRRGFRGSRCKRKVGVGRCHERRCRNGGTCKQIGPLKWKCLCRRGFRGSRCKRKVGVGRCHERRCRNGGTCKQIGPLKWKCLCRRGFRGSRCKRKVGVGRCHERRCRNGGTCKQIGPLKWICLCRRGFRGSRCKGKVGVGRCHERRCRNGGTCKQIGPLKWKCLCRRGFRGSRCKRKVGVGRCHERRCRNGGTCKQIGPLKWICLCRRGFRGSRCKRKVGVGRCHERRCRNGGTCKQIGPLKWKCLCRRGFRGRRCRRKVGVGRCHERRCRNGGTCKQIGPLKWKCLCRRGFRGRRCRRKVGVGRCHERRCRNGGTCKQIGPLKWKCLCRRGFRGRRCRKKVGVGRCHERRCRNGGTCKQIGPLKWKCLCRRGFRGRRCRRKVGVGRCHERRCRNGGTCKQIGPLKWKCLCRRGFRGRRCRRKVGVVCSQRKLDILVVEDVSNSIGKLQYSSLKRFEQQMLRSFEINSKAINVAFMVFSVNARVVFQLNAYSNNKPAVLAAVNAQANEGGASTHIGEAIKLANADVFTSRNGDRPDADNMVIFFTDADGTCDDKLDVAANIGYLQAKSEVFVVHTKGRGDTANIDVTISALASDPDNKHAFHVDNSNAVNAIMQRVEACRAQ
ncbi:uncharacterized protein [Haliotis cracherodii]|uniref:uncharacterized protein n=1 Tax=Haliotis cracherodii TaxID=6455 RepID=UPI0039E9DA25